MHSYKTSEQAAGFIRYLRGLDIPCDAAKVRSGRLLDVER